MHFIQMVKTDTYYEFICENGNKLFAPVTEVIIVDDESGAKSIKLTSSRKVLGYVID